VVLLHGGIGGAQLAASLVESDAGSELTEEFGHAMDAARDHRGGEVVRAGDDVADDFGIRGYGTQGSSTPMTVAERSPMLLRRTVLPITLGSFS
jgi:hypothetical protein